jgi:hypothetical protein
VYELVVKTYVELYSFALQLPKDGTPMPKHVAVLIIVINCILLNTFVGGYINSSETVVNL